MVWPNELSRANSDPWLSEHHLEIQQVRPRVLVLNFGNDTSPEVAQTRVEQVVEAFVEASISSGHSTPQYVPEVSRIVDARDGIDGRPLAPADWPYRNSTLLPLRAADDEGYWSMDYAEFFEGPLTTLYGDEGLGLCELVDRGDVNELWFVAYHDPGVDPAELLEMKLRYDADGNRLEGPLERCAGNGCFDLGVPLCNRSIRIGFINVERGPGCFIHSVGHGMEWTGRRTDLVPSFSEWFIPFAGFDLATRYPALGGIGDWYEGCGYENSSCLSYPTPTTLTANLAGQPEPTTLDPYAPVCGNVHFPPNARAHYDHVNDNAVQSTCTGFGGIGESSEVSAATWAEFDVIAPDCSGSFLTWWMKQMPGVDTAHAHDDGRPMASIWPYLYY